MGTSSGCLEGHRCVLATSASLSFYSVEVPNDDDEDSHGVQAALLPVSVFRAVDAELYSCIEEYLDWKTSKTLCRALSSGHVDGRVVYLSSVGEMEISGEKIEALDAAIGEADACSAAHSIETEHLVTLATCLRRCLLAVKGRETHPAYELL